MELTETCCIVVLLCCCVVVLYLLHQCFLENDHNANLLETAKAQFSQQTQMEDEPPAWFISGSQKADKQMDNNPFPDPSNFSPANSRSTTLQPKIATFVPSSTETTYGATDMRGDDIDPPPSWMVRGVQKLENGYQEPTPMIPVAAAVATTMEAANSSPSMQRSAYERRHNTEVDDDDRPSWMVSGHQKMSRMVLKKSAESTALKGWQEN
jgi:hypothetical protein